MDTKDTDYPEGLNEASDIDEQVLPVEFTNEVDADDESDDVDIPNNQAPEVDEEEDV